jgi:hypothetical protein
MYSKYRIAGSSATLHRMRSRIEFRRLYGCWPLGASDLTRQVESEIEALIAAAVEEGASIRVRGVVSIRKRREAALRAKLVAAESRLQSN